MVLDSHTIKWFLNVAVGNGKKFNCKNKRYSRHVNILMITVYLLFFTIGLYAGELSTMTAINIESFVSMVSSVTIAGLGSAILYDCWHDSHCLGFVSLAVISIMLAQAAYVFQLFSLPIVNSLFELTSIISMVILYIISQGKR